MSEAATNAIRWNRNALPSPFFACPVTQPVYLNSVKKRKIEAEQILSHFCWVNNLWSLKQVCMFKDALPICITCDVKLNGPWNVQEDMQAEWITSHQNEV